jgi:hypothetical protein
VSDYTGLPGFDPRQRQRTSSSLCVETSSEVYSACCTVGTGCPFPRSKARPGRDADHPDLVPKSRMNIYTFSPPCSLHGGSGTVFLIISETCYWSLNKTTGYSVVLRCSIPGKGNAFVFSSTSVIARAHKTVIPWAAL